jgi:pimeloyl-ACP methyl ester carboxylesterase
MHLAITIVFALLTAHLPVPPNLPPPEAGGLVPVNGVKIWYGSYGSGSAVILLEGGKDSSDDWGFLVPDLVRNGYRAIVIDTRCQGRSTCSPQPLGYHLFAQDVVGVMDRLHLRRASFVGFSDGAIVGLDIAMHYPGRVTRLFAHGANSSVSTVSFVPSTDPAVRARIEEAKVWTEARYRVESPAPNGWSALEHRVDRMWNTQPNYTRTNFEAIRTPVWIVDGDHEEYVKRSDTDMMAHAIRGAAELILPDSDDYALWEHPALFDEAVLTFLGDH